MITHFHYHQYLNKNLLFITFSIIISIFITQNIYQKSLSRKKNSENISISNHQNILKNYKIKNKINKIFKKSNKSPPKEKKKKKK